jgi:hypothetical protein
MSNKERFWESAYSGAGAGRPFEKRRSGHLAGRRAGPRNKKTLAAALLAGESGALTKRAVELALAGDPWTFSPRALSRGGRCGSASNAFWRPAASGRSSLNCRRPKVRADIAPAMKAVTSALAADAITPGEAATIAAVFDTFVRAIETSDLERCLKIVEADLPECPRGVPKMFDTGLVGNSIGS